MASERIQRRIDALLDQAEGASNQRDWATAAPVRTRWRASLVTPAKAPPVNAAWTAG